MRFGVLGPTEVLTQSGDRIAVGGPRVRTLLALLVLDAGRVVSPERLIDGMYGEYPPDGVANALQSQVSRLRQALKAAGNVVEFSAAGYRLAADRDNVDAHRFERLAEEGRRALKAADHAKAAETLREALALWRGQPFADIADAPFVEPQIARLTELKLTATEDRIEAELTLGQHRDLVAELQEIVAANPLRERPRAQLMRALHGSGRQADALAAYDDARRTLADELGADPGPELAEAHLLVLRGEPEAPAAVENVLPAQFTSFVGRDEELRRVGELLERGRLVTLTGPGGTGKTRLAIEAASKARSVGFVELAPLASGADVPQAVLATLGLREAAFAIPPQGGNAPHQPTERLVAALAERSMLLVFDNCEHVIDAIAQLAARLLATCPGLRILATSREPLGITGELIAPVPRLAVSPPGTPAEAALGYPAVRLFADRASAGRADFTVTDETIGDVQRICAALDGLPLAIELAAARVRSLPLGEIAVRLDDRFQLLSRGSRTAVPRHRTLRAAVEWSWELLDAEEQQLARRLTVFSGGATLEAAEEIVGVPDTVDVLTGLVDKSLVEVNGDRYRMLETIRAFCTEKLVEHGEAEDLRGAHAEYFLKLAQTADPYLRTGEQLIWLSRLDADYENILAALRWSTESQTDLALRLVSSLCRYWWMRGRRFEGAMLSIELAKRVGPVPPADLREEFLLCVLSAMTGMHDYEPLREHIAVVEAYGQEPPWIPKQPMLTMLQAVVVGPPEEGSPLHEWEIELILGSDDWSRALVSMGTGLRAQMAGEIAKAERCLAEGLVKFRAVGDRWGMSMSLDHLAEIVAWRGDSDRALNLMNEALDLLREIGATDDTAELLVRRGEVRARFEDVDGAQADFTLAIDLARRTGLPETRAAGRLGLAELARLSGDLPSARSLGEQVLAECPTGGFTADDVRSRTYISLGRVAEAEGNFLEATAHERKALESPYTRRNRMVAASAVEAVAGAMLLDGNAEHAALLLGAAVSLRGASIAGDPDVARVRAGAVAQLGVEDFERSYEVGHGLPTTKALTIAGLTS
ncbi:Predicted ATPase [Amycolatopsis xylanica]|uniref:Predicted ATPase n=1 Tax=Amycolatopsis xylanica TaxID=589385 RepID=A0A1H3ST65_9PSEU|nr:BTAD domain-containing putative transcriptional regulator [Amycolatopsis xylanica]SDZ41134.1 Predicted ATPase [Amycolatopsis xylanica]